MLPSKPHSTTGTNVFGKIWITHRSLNYLRISSKVRLLGFIHQDMNKGEKQNWMNIKKLLICFNIQQSIMYK